MPLPRPAPGRAPLWVFATALLIAAVAVVAWIGVRTNVGKVIPQVTGYKVLSDQEIRVDYRVYRPSGVVLVCVVTGLDSAHGRVGAVEDEVPASDQGTTYRSVTVRTTQRAVTGVVDSCVRR